MKIEPLKEVVTIEGIDITVTELDALQRIECLNLYEQIADIESGADDDGKLKAEDKVKRMKNVITILEKGTDCETVSMLITKIGFIEAWGLMLKVLTFGGVEDKKKSSTELPSDSDE